MAGPQGEQGLVGPVGPQGPQGAQGPTGLSAAYIVPNIWSGGCSHHGDVQAAWNTYCLDRTDFSTATEHLTIGANSITILKAGFYRITFRTIGLGPADGAIALLQNGQTFHTNLKDPGTGGDWYWRETNADVMWPFNAGDVISLQVWNLGLYAYHSSSPTGAYSRMQVQYLGPLQ